MDKTWAPMDLSTCFGDNSGLVRNSLTDLWGTAASNCSLGEDFAANGLSIIERDEKSILAKNLPTSNITLDGIDKSDISWQLSGDISLFRTDCSLKKGNRTIGDSSIQGVPADNTTFLRSMLARISEESEQVRSSGGSESTNSSSESYLTTLSQESQPNRPISSELKDDPSEIDFSNLSTDWRSAASFLRSQPIGCAPTDKNNFTAEFNAKDLSFLTKRPAANSDQLAIFKRNSTLPSFCGQGGINEESVLDLSNMSQVLRRLKQIPDDVSGTDIADMLLPPPDGVSTKDRLAKHPEVTAAVPSMDEILKMMHSMKSASPTTFVDGLLRGNAQQLQTDKPQDDSSTGKSSQRQISSSRRDRTADSKGSSSIHHKNCLKTKKLNENLLAYSSSMSKSRQLGDGKVPKPWL